MMYQGNTDSVDGIKICPKCGAFNPVLQLNCSLCSEAFELESDAAWFALTQADNIRQASYLTRPVLEEHPVAHGGVSDTIFEVATTDVWLLTRSIVDKCINSLHLHG